MTNTEVNNRFIEVLDYLGFTKNGKITKSAIAEYIGVSPSTIGEIVSYANGVGVSVLTGLCEKNPEISATWILTGKGFMVYGEEELISERKHDKIKTSEKCQECERNKFRVEIFKEANIELKRENKLLIEENAILKNKLTN